MISAVIMAYNEAENIPGLMESLKGIGDIVVCDHESTDETVKIAQSLGARVFIKNNMVDRPTEEDREDFIAKYHYKPTFTRENLFFNGAEDYNYGSQQAKNDWIFYPDCDERLEWDQEKIMSLLDSCDMVKYTFVHSDTLSLINSKFAKRSKYQWKGRIHQVLTGSGREVFTEDMKLIHHQKPREYRNDFLQKMEWAVVKDNDTRTKFYLAREYFYHKRYQDALTMFHEYLETATYRPEIADAWLTMAKCSWEIQQGDDARKFCLNAISVNPDFAEALHFMSIYTGEGQSEYWKRMSLQATSNNVLFKHAI